MKAYVVNKNENGYIVEFGDRDSLAYAVINYKLLKVKDDDVPIISMNNIFRKMLNNE